MAWRLPCPVSITKAGTTGTFGPRTCNTSAPNAASVRPAVGPARTRVRSSTRKPVERASTATATTAAAQCRARLHDRCGQRVHEPALRVRPPLLLAADDRGAASAIGDRVFELDRLPPAVGRRRSPPRRHRQECRAASEPIDQRWEAAVQMDPATVGAAVSTDPRVGGVGPRHRFAVDAHHGEPDRRRCCFRHAHTDGPGIAPGPAGQSGSRRASLRERHRRDTTDRPRSRQHRIIAHDLDLLVDRPPTEIGDQPDAVGVHLSMMAHRSATVTHPASVEATCSRCAWQISYMDQSTGDRTVARRGTSGVSSSGGSNGHAGEHPALVCLEEEQPERLAARLVDQLGYHRCRRTPVGRASGNLRIERISSSLTVASARMLNARNHSRRIVGRLELEVDRVADLERRRALRSCIRRHSSSVHRRHRVRTRSAHPVTKATTCSATNTPAGRHWIDHLAMARVR